MVKRGASFWVWLSLLVLALAGAALLIPAGLLPYETLKGLGDSLSKDGNLERLTPELYHAAHLPVLFAGILLLAGSAAWIIWRGKVLHWLAAAGGFTRRVGQLLRMDWRELRTDLEVGLPARRELLVLLAILLFALLMRLVLNNRPMGFDESYTFTEFARHSFRQIVTDYHVRNNHVFHTLLVRIAYLLFGNAPWVIRLPALIAGLLLIPAVYALGRRLYNGAAGLIAAGGVAVFPALAVYSVNARGYSLLCLFTVLLIFMADYARQKPSLLVWIGMALVTALGMYTIPIMLYPFGIVVTWLFLCGLSGKIHPEYGGQRWLIILAAFCAAAGVLTLLLYAPILSFYGFWAVVNDNPAFETQTLSTFISDLPVQFVLAKPELVAGGLPDAVLWMMAAGSLLALVLNRWISRSSDLLPQPQPLPLAAVLFLVPVLLLQRPVFLARVWMFLLVLMILWTAAVLAGIPRLLRLAEARQRQVRIGTTAVLLLVMLAASVRFLAPYVANPDLLHYPPLYDTERVTLYLKDRLQEGDIVVISSLDDAPYWYYFTYYHIPDEHIRSVKTRSFRRVFVITHPVMQLSVEGLLSKFGPDLWFLRMETLQLETQIGDTLIYSVQPNQAAIDQEFGLQPAK